MNFWSLCKHKSIKLLMFKLQQHLGSQHYRIDEQGNNDSASITLFKPDQEEVRAYVYTHGQPERLYGIHLEYSWFAENEYQDPVLIYENLTMMQIVTILASHFDATCYDMAG
jgi:hypothetical protein